MISVVIPLYNKAHTIEKTLAAVFSQSYQDFEIIVVDDGSTDKGPDIVKALASDKIRLVQRPNAGPGEARNTGIREAKGELIAFLDADDTWLTDHLSNLIRLKNDFPEAEVFATDYAWVSATKVLTKKTSFCPRGYIGNYFQEFYRLKKPIFCASSVSIAQSAVAKVGYFDPILKSSEDILYWAKLALHCKIAFDPQVTSLYYFETEGNITDTLKKRQAKIGLEDPIVDFLQNELKAHRVPAHIVKAVKLYSQFVVLYRIKRLLLARQPGQAIKCLIVYWSNDTIRVIASTIVYYARKTLKRQAKNSS